jgi:hypothetical protein
MRFSTVMVSIVHIGVCQMKKSSLRKFHYLSYGSTVEALLAQKEIIKSELQHEDLQHAKEVASSKLLLYESKTGLLQHDYAWGLGLVALLFSFMIVTLNYPFEGWIPFFSYSGIALLTISLLFVTISFVAYRHYHELSFDVKLRLKCIDELLDQRKQSTSPPIPPV